MLHLSPKTTKLIEIRLLYTYLSFFLLCVFAEAHL